MMSIILSSSAKVLYKKRYKCPVEHDERFKIVVRKILPPCPFPWYGGSTRNCEMRMRNLSGYEEKG